MPVEHRLDVVPVRIEHEGRVVAGVVVAFTRRAVVAPARGERGAMEGLHRLAIGRLEGQVHA